MRTLNIVALTLVIIGGLNWGLVGAFNFDFVAALFGHGTPLARIVYGVVAVAALYSISFYKPISYWLTDDERPRDIVPSTRAPLHS